MSYKSWRNSYKNLCNFYKKRGRRKSGEWVNDPHFENLRRNQGKLISVWLVVSNP
jgi:hypothetical protein